MNVDNDYQYHLWVIMRKKPVFFAMAIALLMFGAFLSGCGKAPDVNGQANTGAEPNTATKDTRETTSMRTYKMVNGKEIEIPAQACRNPPV